MHGFDSRTAHSQLMTEQTQTKKSDWYDRTYKLLLIPPALFLIFALVYLAIFYQQNGDLFYKDVSITGGTTITVFKAVPVEAVEQALRDKFPDMVIRGISDLRTGTQTGFFVETGASVEELKPALEEFLGFTLTSENSSIEFTGAALSTSFYAQLRLALLIAFFFMALVVFVIFRTIVPSLAVILAAFADIISTIVVIDLIGLQLSLAGIVALLMLVGYSVDTDILLTTRVLKKGEGTINHRIFGAFKTGMMMTLTAIAAVGISLLFTQHISDTLSQIFTILLIGLAFDIFNTWLTNASMLKWYAEVKKLA